jgi:putative transposase
MVLENRGSLVGLDRRKVEVRFDPDNPDSGAFALDPRDGKPVVLRRVERPEMLDGGAASKAMGIKKENMKAVIGTCRAAVGKVLVFRGDAVSAPYLEARKAAKPVALTGDAASDSAAEAEIKPKHARVFVSDRDRYVSVLDSLRAGAALSARDADFKAKFEASMTDADALCFANYSAFNN